jgi:hypothetical protein
MRFLCPLFISYLGRSGLVVDCEGSDEEVGKGETRQEKIIDSCEI